MFWKSAKSDREDEEIADNYAEVIEALGNRRTLLRFLYLSIAVNCLIWLIVFVFPETVYEMLSPVVTDKIGVAVLGVPWGCGFFITYCLLRIKLPDIEENKNLQSEMMASFAYQANSSKRYFVWIGSIVAGVLNVAFLIALDLYLVQ